MEVEQLGHKMVPRWDASVGSCGLTCCTTMPAPVFFFFSARVCIQLLGPSAEEGVCWWLGLCGGVGIRFLGRFSGHKVEVASTRASSRPALLAARRCPAWWLGPGPGGGPCCRCFAGLGRLRGALQRKPTRLALLAEVVFLPLVKILGVQCQLFRK